MQLPKIDIDGAYKGIDSAFRERLTKSDLKHFQNGYNQAVSDMAELERKEFDKKTPGDGCCNDERAEEVSETIAIRVILV